MGKMVGMAEFKANCTRLLRELEQDGEPITVTVRGKPVAVVSPSAPKPKRESLFGVLAGTVTINGDFDLTEPIDPDWEAKWEAKWNALGYPAPQNSKSEL